MRRIEHEVPRQVVFSIPLLHRPS